MGRHEGRERGLPLVAVELRGVPDGDVALRPDDRRSDLCPIGIGAEQVEHVHSRLEPEELQDLRRLAAGIQLDVVGASFGAVSDRGGDRGGSRGGSRNGGRGKDESEGDLAESTHGITPLWWMPSIAEPALAPESCN